jgi:hypothetical protein
MMDMQFPHQQAQLLQAPAVSVKIGVVWVKIRAQAMQKTPFIICPALLILNLVFFQVVN